ncbi:hypothetical protein SH661x_000987 [Planctomicrobium sp. SH661]|uniref:hypothetical protein n=1 Tax=Planctomicrobium sp. SH661 TaxID=3448124 RepID=UPI003F5B9378
MAEPGQNPFETPRPRGIRVMQGALRVTVALQCFGIAAARLHHELPDQFINLLTQGRELPADQITHYSTLVAYGLIVCGIFTLLRPATLILFPLIIYQAGTAIATPVLSDLPAAQLEPAIQATRSIAPLALLLIDFWPPRIKTSLVMCLAASTLLKLATAVTFIAQGILFFDQARQGGPLLTQIHEALQHTIRESITLEQARVVLAGFSLLETGVAIALLTGRSRLVMAMCVAVGLLAAFLPTLADGTTGYSESLARISQAGAPLAILLFHIACVQEQPPIYLPEKRKIAMSPPGDPKKRS